MKIDVLISLSILNCIVDVESFFSGVKTEVDGSLLQPYPKLYEQNLYQVPLRQSATGYQLLNQYQRIQGQQTPAAVQIQPPQHSQIAYAQQIPYQQVQIQDEQPAKELVQNLLDGLSKPLGNVNTLLRELLNNMLVKKSSENNIQVAQNLPTQQSETHWALRGFISSLLQVVQKQAQELNNNLGGFTSYHVQHEPPTQLLQEAVLQLLPFLQPNLLKGMSLQDLTAALRNVNKLLHQVQIILQMKLILQQALIQRAQNSRNFQALQQQLDNLRQNDLLQERAG